MKNKINIKKSIAMITAGSLIMSTIATVNIKAETLDQLYKRAYDSAIKVKTTAEKNGVKPFFTTGGKISGTKEVVKAVQAGLQTDINDARLAQNNLLYNYPEYRNAVGTFSSLVDNYQHPIYERIVFELETMVNREFNQGDINSVRQLINGVSDEFKPNFSSALDSYQQKYIEKVVEAVELAEQTKNKVDIDGADKLVADLKTVTFNDDVRGFAIQLKTRIDIMKIKVTEAKVVGVNTIELRGEGLTSLSSDYVSLGSNEVEIITPTANGSSAKIIFKNKFSPNEDMKLNVTIGENTQNFAVKFEYIIKYVAINNVKYKAEKAGQKISIRTNSDKEEADLDYIKKAGYTVKFYAYDSQKVPVNIFEGGFNSSTTGVLDETIYEGKFQIEVEISKIGENTVSAKQLVEVEKNLDNNGENNNNVTVSSVYINKEIYNNRKAGQKITFKINGNDKNCDLSYLTSNGYSVRFSAIDDKNEAADIFEQGITSYTGILKDQLNVGSYTVQMQIYKDGATTISSKQTIDVIDNFNSIASITNVLLKNDLKSEQINMNSTTLVVGEEALIAEVQGTVKGQNGTMIIPKEYVEALTSNKSVANIYRDGNDIRIKGENSGTAVITVKAANAKKEIYIKVTKEDRKVTRAIPSESSIRVVEGKERKFNLLFLDQYGDPIRVSTDENIAVDPNRRVKVEMKQYDGPIVASVTPLNVTTLNSDGRYLGFGITGNNKGEGTLIFKDVNDRIMWQGPVSVSNKDDVKERKVEFFYDSPVTKNTFEVGQEAKYQLSNFNSENMFNGISTLSPLLEDEAYTVESSDKNIASVTIEGNIFKVTGLKQGGCDIIVKNKKGPIQKLRVNIVNNKVSGVEITKVYFIKNPTIDYYNRLINVRDVLDIKDDAGKDGIVYGIEHNKTTIFPVRIDAEGQLYIDEDNDGKLGGSDDVLLGKVTMQRGTKYLDVFSGIVTSPGDNYRLDFKVLSDKNKNTIYEDNEIVASTSVNVNVKKLQ